jgi:hypothetical protein
MVQELRTIGADTEEQLDGVGDSSSKGNFRSGISFPYVDLQQAVQLTRAAYEEAEDISRVAVKLGHSVSSGTFRLKVAAAKLFGLVETGGKKLTPTNIGEQVVRTPGSKRLLAAAFLNVPLYKTIYDKYEGRPLPKPTGLEGFMEAEGVAPKQTDKARRIFARSATHAGFFDMNTEMLVVPADEPGQIQDEAIPHDVEPPHGPRRAFGPASNLPLGSKGRLLDGLFEALPLPGEEWPEHGPDGWKQWLATAEAIFRFVYPDPKKRTEPDRH